MAAEEGVPYRDAIHKFTLVRPPAKYDERSLETRFVILEASLSTKQARQVAAPDSNIVGIFQSGDLDRVRRGVSWLKGKKRWIESLAAFAAGYPNSRHVYSSFARDSKSATSASLTDAIEAALGKFDPIYTSIAKYLDEAGDAYFTRKLTLWENLLVRFYNLTETPEVREECLRMVRLFWIMERLKVNTLNDADVSDALRATVVLPKIEAQPTPSIAVPPSPPQNEAAVQKEKQRELALRLQSLHSAAAELTRQQSIQQTKAARTRGVALRKVPLPGVLESAHAQALSKSTHATLRQMRISTANLHVPTVLGQIQTEIKAITSPARPTVVPRLFKVGSSFVTGSSISAASTADPLVYPGVTSTMPAPGSPASVDPFAPGMPVPVGIGQGFKVGMAPLYVVETKLLKYEKGEVAHIEALLAGESKKRNLRVLNRVEQVVATDDETTVVAEKDSQTTDKNELSHEISTNQKEDMKFDTGLKVTADLGSVNIAASADFAYANAKESTDKTASTQARETVNKAVNSITTRTRTQRTVTTVNESEEKNDHELTNKNPKTNISGIYRWLDKYYLAALKCYGTRKMLEFSIPEPAAFYVYVSRNKKTAGVSVDVPVVPMIYAPDDPPATTDANQYRPIQTYADIRLPSEDPTNIYMDQLNQSYGYVIPIAPQDNIASIQTIKSQAPADGGSSDDTKSQTGSTNLVIPADYYCYSLSLTGSYDASGLDPKDMLYFAVGDLAMSINDFATDVANYPIHTWKGESWIGPISVAYHLHVKEFVVEITAQCFLTAAAKDKWRKAAFDAIMAEYTGKLKAYNQWLKDQADEAALSVTISGNAPARNREIEQEELKKSCIELMTAQRYESFDAMRYSPSVPPGSPYYAYPDFSFTDAAEEGRFAQFFEEVFDWHLMTYEFYPYFWGNKQRWTFLKSLDDTDPLFRDFLQAGAARVQVPVRRNFEDMVDHFIRSKGELWNGGETPIPGDPLWLSIADDQKNNTDDDEGELVDQWIIKLPTDLIFLDDFGAEPPNNTAALKGEMFQKIKDQLGIK